ncbi:hypothetical protein GCM10027161_18110 [Microbispora hainanensis]
MPRVRRNPPPKGPQRLPQRWILILTVAATISALVSQTEGPTAALISGLLAAGTLHKVIE